MFKEVFSSKISVFLLKFFSTMLPIIKQIAEEFKDELQRLYGDEFAELILFGSHARGDFHEESDIDFAVVLKDKTVRTTPEIFKTSPISTALGLKYGVSLSTFPTAYDKIKNSMQGIYQEIRKDGIII
jgi:predicted nucleotidyltransferase